MSWQFETDPEFQAELDWVAAFVEAELAPAAVTRKRGCG